MIKIKQADYWLNLSYIKEIVLGLKKQFKEMPFSVIRIQTLKGKNINKLIEQFPEELFKDVGSAYNYDNLYFFVLPEELEKTFVELDKINSEAIECIGHGFFSKTVRKDLHFEMCMFYEKRKARKGTVIASVSELKWLSEPIFRLDEAREVMFTKGEQKEVLIGLGCYTPEEWPLFKKYSQDCLEETYEEWQQSYESLKSNLEKNGKKTVAVPIKVEEMQQYFAEKGLENISKNRATYVSERLIEMKNEGKLDDDEEISAEDLMR